MEKTKKSHNHLSGTQIHSPKAQTRMDITYPHTTGTKKLEGLGHGLRHERRLGGAGLLLSAELWGLETLLAGLEGPKPPTGETGGPGRPYQQLSRRWKGLLLAVGGARLPC